MEFDLFIHLASLMSLDSEFRHMSINLPIKLTRVDTKWAQLGQRRGSIRVNERKVTLFYEIKRPKEKKEGVVIGADQGLRKCVTLSDGQQTGSNKQGKDLVTISKKLAHRKKGSKGFHRAQSERENYINWSINQLDLSQAVEVRLENIKDLRKNKKPGYKPLTHWTYPLIRRKLYHLSETKSFRLEEIDPTYNSQRCSQCGLVLKENRKGSRYQCQGCGASLDSDCNAALNIALDLPKIPREVRLKRLNLKGFFWNSISSGKEPIVPYTKKGRI